MERWKLTFATKYDPLQAIVISPGAPIVRPRTKEERTAIAERYSAVYECAHGLAVYRLRADEVGLFCLPRPVCAECVGDMLLIYLFGENRGSW